jgi:hypothetical protein
MNENLIRVQEEVDLGKAGIVQLAENAFESVWLPVPPRINTSPNSRLMLAKR